METRCDEPPRLPEEDRHGKTHAAVPSHHHPYGEWFEWIGHQQLASIAEHRLVGQAVTQTAVGLQQEVQDLRVQHPAHNRSDQHGGHRPE